MKMTENKDVWVFPESISFDKAAEFVERLNENKDSMNLVFDLSSTINIHSSFIGFLIHAKHHLNRRGVNLTLILSLTVEKLLILLNIIEYFSPDVQVNINKKTA